MNKSTASHKTHINVPVFLGLMVGLVLIALGSYWLEYQLQMSPLRRAIKQYNVVIQALKQYHDEQGHYPADLTSLRPGYLDSMSDIYNSLGEVLEYDPTPSFGSPFTFFVYGHHPGLNFLHGWELRYCPISVCSYPVDRHYHPHRIDDWWIWVNRSAL
jgi:hypothetical protein